MAITNIWRRSTTNRMIGGVCGGLAQFFAIDASLLRAAWVLFFLLGGTGGLLYLALWGILPDETGERTTLPWLLFVLALALPLLYAIGLVPFGLPATLFP
jgi:phage shock protein C